MKALSIALIAGVLAMAPAASASEAGDSLRLGLGRLTRVAPDSPEFPAAVDGFVDHSTLGARVFEGLGGGAAAERDEARRLLVDVVRVVMGRHATRLKGATVTWGIEMKDGGSQLVAKSVVRSGGESADVDWVMVRRGGVWRLADVVTEGVSMVATWKRSLAAAHGRGGWPGVLKKLRRAGEAN